MRLFRVGVFIAVVLSAGPLAAQTLRIYQIDVEQADAALFVMPNGKTLLIDAGKNGQGQRIRNVMATAGVTQIDAFVATHCHEDHFGGIDDSDVIGGFYGTLHDTGCTGTASWRSADAGGVRRLARLVESDASLR